MRIVNGQDFLKLPAGVLYQKYAPCVLEGICLKGETRGDTWLYTDLMDTIKSDSSDERIDILFEAVERGTSFEMDYFCEDRDSLDVKDQLFMIYEKRDIEQFMYFIISRHNNYPQLKFKKVKSKLIKA